MKNQPGQQPKTPKQARVTDKKKRASKSTIALARTVFIFIGIFLGWGLITVIKTRTDWPFIEKYTIVCQISMAALMGIVLFFTTPAIIKGLFRFSDFMESALSGYTGREIFMGVVGLILGVILSIAGGYLLSLIIPDSAIVYFITAILIVVFGFTGIRVGTKMLSDVWQPASNIEKSNPVRSQSDIKILDSSSLIDGRILDIVRTGFLSGAFLIPDFILTELSKIADNEDPLKKNRGRRGLDIAAELQKERGIHVEIDYSIKEEWDTDSKLLSLAAERLAKLITVDYNLNKLSVAKNVEVLNVNELANAIKPIALPGERMTVRIVKEGKEAGQGVAFSPDGTMIVVENGGGRIGKEADVTITTSLQTSAGRIIFARIM